MEIILSHVKMLPETAVKSAILILLRSRTQTCYAVLGQACLLRSKYLCAFSVILEVISVLDTNTWEIHNFTMIKHVSNYILSILLIGYQRLYINSSLFLHILASPVLFLRPQLQVGGSRFLVLLPEESGGSGAGWMPSKSLSPNKWLHRQLHRKTYWLKGFSYLDR